MQCTYDTCTRDEPLRKGYCTLHYQRFSKYGTPDGRPLVTCSGPECNRVIRRNGLCDTHDAQSKRGKPLTPIVPKSRKGYWLRDENGNRTCTRCDKAKTDRHFSRNSRTKDGLHYYCKACERGLKLERNYGLTTEQYRDMLISQDYLCANPGCDASGELTRPLHVDHDHSCCPSLPLTCGGKCVRGLLCGPCNTAYGLLMENPVLLQGLIDYQNSTTGH